MVRLLPEPWVCQTTPMRRSPGSPPGRRPASYRPFVLLPRRFGLELRGAQRLLHRHVDGVELVIAGHLLDERAAAVVLEDDEVADQVEEPALLEHALDHHLQLGQVRVGQRPRPRWCARA